MFPARQGTLPGSWTAPENRFVAWRPSCCSSPSFRLLICAAVGAAHVEQAARVAGRDDNTLSYGICCLLLENSFFRPTYLAAFVVSPPESYRLLRSSNVTSPRVSSFANLNKHSVLCPSCFVTGSSRRCACFLARASILSFTIITYRYTEVNKISSQRSYIPCPSSLPPRNVVLLVFKRSAFGVLGEYICGDGVCGGSREGRDQRWQHRRACRNP